MGKGKKGRDEYSLWESVHDGTDTAGKGNGFEDWQATFDAIGDAICLLDRNHLILKYNRAMSELFGSGGISLAGRTCHEICHNSPKPVESCPVTRMMRTGVRETSEMPIGDRVYEVTADPCFDEQGNLQGTVHILKDISAQRRSEKEISQREATLRQILDTSSVAIFLVDRLGRITHANKRMGTMFGCTVGDLVGSEYVSLVHPEERETGRRKMLALLASEIHSVDLERRYSRTDGSEFWGRLTGRRFLDVHGNDLGLIGVISDITERRRAEERLISSEKKFSAIFSLIPDPTTITDIETGRIIDVNDAAARWFGRSREEVIGMTTAEVQVWVDPADRDRMLREMQEKGEINDMEFLLRRHDGGIRHTLFSSRLFEIEGTRYLLSRAHDITGVKRAEEEKRDLERQLIQAQRLESLGSLAGGIAHDFNNLLQGVFGYLSMAKITLDERDKAAVMLEQAEQALQRSVGLTSQLLTFSKGGKPLRKRLDPGPVIRQAVRFATSGSSAEQNIDIDTGLRTIEADEAQIAQVIQNLVINAVQAMPWGGAVSVAARNVRAPGAGIPAVLPPGNYVVVTVGDSGVGMPEEYLARIFDPYFTTRDNGSGLGLAISYSIVKNHCGTIDVASAPGSGSTFSVYLPAVTDDIPEARERGENRGVERKGRVLLMDDEEIVRNVAREMIGALGHTVDCAARGEEAVEMYRKAKGAGTPYDVVILDLTVRGGMGGAEAMEKLLEVDPGVKAVVSSGYADDSVIAEYRSRGFCATLGKPYMISRLRSTLETVLSL